MEKVKLPYFASTPNVLLVGEIVDTVRGSGNVSSSGNELTDAFPTTGTVVQQASVAMMSIRDFRRMAGKFAVPSGEHTDSGRKHPWNSIGAVSLDALFTPFTNAHTGHFLPHFENPSSTETATSLTLDPFNPLNLLSNEGKTYTDTEKWQSRGHNIGLALNYNPYDSGNDGQGGYVGTTGSYPTGVGKPVDLSFEKDHFARAKAEVAGIRSVGFRSPMVLSGWGYDTEGNPVPYSGDQKELHPEATWNPNLWKTGPVDLRWDDDRKVWTGGNTVKISLCKVTNTYNPESFSYEVDRSRTRDQYARNAPTIRRDFSPLSPLYDPEYVAYYNNSENIGQYESLDYDGVEFPYYEAFVIRSTADTVNSSSYYNIWTEDCNDCGPIQNECAGSGSTTLGAHSGIAVNRKVLIENPLKQSLDTGDLCFTVNTGRSRDVNTGTFTGGSGTGALGNLIVNSTGGASFQVVSSGADYSQGAFALTSGCSICANITLYFTSGYLASGSVDPDTGLKSTGLCPVQIIPSNAEADTEKLPIHWIMQSEFKSQQVVTHAECSAGVLQTCTMKIQTQGFKTCEHCGEDTAFINAY
jgi:hypothetical protein